ncbi:MAG TPA: ABC transporter permease subunit [Thermoanaerobaculia bacterium]|nr:ABC transporter permease subunit [Thermoanaerobaculia bacterium]
MSSLTRARSVYGLELSYTLKRPLFWFLILLAVLLSWVMSTGDMQISSGDSSVGGQRAWVTSEFSVAFILCIMVCLVHSLFLSIAAGTVVVRDDESRTGELLHSTLLRPAEYIWGKFLAVLTGFLLALLGHLLFMVVFNHVIPNAEAVEVRGPFELANYLRPSLVFGLPMLIFMAGVSFWLGERFRRPLAVFLFPIAILLVSIFFFWDWTPTWLDPRIDRLLMWLDPAGFRWLNQTWLKLDRGARFYNMSPIGLDTAFVLSRAAFTALGVLGVALAQRHLARSLRGARVSRAEREQVRHRVPRALDEAVLTAARAAVSPSPLAALGMRNDRIGFTRGSLRIAGTELRNLLAAPGLYLFAALILFETLGNSLIQLGPFGTRLLITPGQLAVSSSGVLSFLLVFLLMFYTVESIERDLGSGSAPILYATPIPTASILFGKSLANSVVGVFMVVATFLGCAIALLIQGKVGFDLGPFLLVWGLLLVPTFLVWTSFILAVRAITGQRYATYAIGLAVIVFTGYKLLAGEVNWVGNWPLWGVLGWSDMGPFQLDARALLLNRLMVLGLTALFTVIAVQAFQRRQTDAIATLHRAAPRQIGRAALRLAPVALVPLVCGVSLWLAIQGGFQGDADEKKGRDYWKKNLATWLDAPQPSLSRVELDLRFEPERRWFRNQGTYELINDRDAPLTRFALTSGRHWKDVKWTLNGKPYEPDNRAGLYVFTPPGPFPPGGRLRIGFRFEGTFPEGNTKNGGGTSEFILPAGVVLTSFTPSFTPVLGFVEGIGRKEDENDYEPRDYPPDFYQGRTDAGFGLNRSFTTRIRVTGPAEYTWNSVGTRTSDTVAKGLRTAVWESDRPVRFFNVVAGRWSERRGKGTVIYYHPEHGYNIDEMSATLDAARHWYSAWFHPFPWRELKLSEFPNLDTYAQGFPTNITFSEGIGFLTKSDIETDAVFVVTAHESAHQWWGNLLTPGEGPGGNILSEGMSHFSTLLLLEQVKGARARMEFAKRIEERYGDERRVDVEKPLVWIEGSREGDTTVTYDKGGWVFWMLLEHMGRERALAGLRRFIADWGDKPDHPVLQDFIATMRPFAPDPAAYDAFTRQWFHEVALPQYELSGARKEKRGAGWEVVVKVKNAGTGRMPVEVAAARGERYTEEGKAKPGYRDARTPPVVLGPGEEKEVRIACAFEPERVLADPDVHVLQLRRKTAVFEL